MAMRDRITDPIVKVFVSSTWEDLQPERDAVEVALQRLHEPKYVGMEYFGSRDEDTRRASLDEVDRCQVYVGIFGGRYGSGITEAEYRRARDRGLPCLIYFKHEAHIPLEWQEADPEKAERLARLKEELRQHHTISPPFTTPDDLAAKVTADLHRWLSGEFPAPQRDAYIKPWRVHLDRFVGRKWLIAKVDDFLQNNDRGYFILEAKAGLGKTTFLAHLVKERGYIHHFVEWPPGPDGIAPGLKNLATQLMRAWELAPYSVDEVRPGTPVRPDFLQNLLLEAARRRDQVKPQEKIVLVVDALDEAETPFGQNVLGLPKVLPQGVYFIVSQRPVEVRLAVEGRRLVFRLEATNEQNLADMRVHLEKIAATWEGVIHALQENGYSAQQFVETLQRKCQGVWMYLYYVVGEIERGERSPLDLDTLPQGMWQYYAQHWQRWRNENSDDWDRVHFPLLSTLAAVQEAASLRHLCALAGVEEQPALRHLLEVAWFPFLAMGEGEEHRYRMYHASLREFLYGRVDLTAMTTSEQSLTRELAEATHRAHARIADRYLAAWGGLDAGLPGLQDPAKRDMDGRYGLRHLATHLEEAGRVNDLHRLLQVEWRHQDEEQFRLPGWPGPLGRLLGPPPVRVRTWYENAWYAAHEHAGDTSGYLSDLGRAWRLAEQASDRQIRREELVASVGLEVRYALINASFNSLAANIPESLLMALVTEQVFTPAQGLAYARQVPDPAQRAAALASLALCLSAPESTNALRSAVAAAHMIRDSGFQSEMLDYLAVQLAEAGYPGEALAAAQAIQDKEAQAKTLVRLAPQLAKLDYLDEVLSAVLKLPGGNSWRLGIRSKTLAELAACLTELGYLKDALVAVQAIENPEQQVEALAELAPHLTEGLVKTALLPARSSSWLWQKARAVLIPRLAQLGHYEDALSRVRELSDSSVFDEYRAAELTGLAPHFPKALLWDVLAEAWRIGDKDQRARTVAGLAPYLTDSQLCAVLDIQEPSEQSHQAAGDLGSYRDHEEVDRSETLAALVPRLAELGYLEEAVAATREIGREAIRSKTLIELGRYLPESLLRQALGIAREIQNEGHRAAALAGLVPRLAELGYPEEALATARVLPEFALGHGNPRAAAFVALARHLPEHLWPELLPLVEGMQVVTARADALAGLAPYLPEPSLPKALALAKEIEWEGLRVKALVKLIPRLSEPLLRDALQTGREIADVDQQAMALSALVSRLIELGDPEEAFATVRLIRDQRYFEDAQTTLIYYQPAKALAIALLDLAPRLPQPMLLEALAAAREIGWPGPRIETLIALALYLPDTERIEVMREALVATREIWNPDEFLRALTDLSRHLPKPESIQALRVALEVVQKFPDVSFGGTSQAAALAELVRFLPGPLLEEALAVARALPASSLISNYSPKVAALSGLAPYLPEPDLTQVVREATAIARSMENEDAQIDIFSDLVLHLPEPFLPEALATLREMPEKGFHSSRAKVLVKLAPRLSQPLLQEALGIAREIHQAEMRFEALTGLASRLEEPERSQVQHDALEATRKIHKAEMRVEALAELASRLEEPQRSQVLHEALEVARNIGKESKVTRKSELEKLLEALGTPREIKSEAERAKALAHLAPLLTEPERGQVIKEALAAARKLPEKPSFYNGPRTIILAGIAPFLPEPARTQTLREALAAMSRVRDQEYCVKLLTSLASHLTDQLLQEVLTAALATVRNVKDEYRRAEALAGLLPWLTEPSHLQEALSLARDIEWETTKIEALPPLVSRLTELGHLKEALAATQELPQFTLEHRYIRAKTLAWLAPHLPDTLLEEALEAAREQYHREAQAEALIGLAPRLPEPLKWEALVTTWATYSEHKSYWVDALTRLAPYLTEPLLRKAIAALREIRDEDYRARALAGLAPSVPKSLLEVALKAAKEIQDDQDALAQALVGLVPRMSEPLLQDMFVAAEKMWDWNAQARVLVAMAPHMTEPLLQKARMVAQFWAGQLGAFVLTKLSEHVSANEHKQMLQEALQTARWVGDARDRAEALVRLVPHLTEPERMHAVREVRVLTQRLWRERDQAEVLIGLMPHLSEPERTQLMREVQGLIRSIRYESLRTEARVLLASQLAKSGYPMDALAMARAIESKEKRVETLAKLAQYLPTATRKQVLQEVARGAQNMEYGRAEILARIVPQLAGSGNLEQALEITRKIDEKHWRDKALAELAPYLSKPLLRTTLDMVRKDEWWGERAEALMALVPRLAELGDPGEALALTQELLKRGYEYLGAQVLARLAPYLPKSILGEAIEVAQHIEWRETRAEALVELIYRLAELGRPTEALAMARELPETVSNQNRCPRVKAMVATVPHLPESMREQVLEEALAAALAIEWEKARVEALAVMATQLAQLGYPEKGLDAARAIKDVDDRVAALAKLAPHLPEPLRGDVLGEVLDAAREIGWERARAGELTELVCQLTEPTRGQALHKVLDAARAIEDANDRATALTGLAPGLAGLPRVTLYLLWRETLQVLAARTRRDLLADIRALAPVVVALGGAAAVTETACAIQDVGRWWR